MFDPCIAHHINQQLSHLRVAFLLSGGEGVGKTACSNLYLGVLQGRLKSINLGGNVNLRKPKTGRTASQAIRDDAALIVAEYRAAQAQVNGKTVLQCFVDGKPMDITLCDSNDVEPLLQYLSSLAETGSLTARDEEDYSLLYAVQLRNEFDRLRQSKRRDAAVEALALRWHVSVDTIDNRLAKINKILPKA